MNVALIDDGVHINNVTREYVDEFLEIRDISTGFKKQTTHINAYSHGTVCAAIIRKISESARIYSLKILDNDNLSAATNKLEKAFEWCLKNDIDIINLSLGTVNSKDFIAIKKWIRCLVKKRVIIVAANNNNNTYTLPASLPGVIGVSSQRNISDFEFINNSIIGIDILACSNHYIQLNNKETIETPFCNSFAAPTVTGKICELINKDYNSMDKSDQYFITNIKKKLNPKYSNLESDFIENMVKCELNQKKLFTNLINSKSNKIKKVPIINIKCSDVDLSRFNMLFYNDNIFPVAVCGEAVLETLKKRHVHDLLYKISGLIDCDLIILYNINKKLVHEELSIEYCSPTFKLSYKSMFRKFEENYQDVEVLYKKVLSLLE